MGCREREGFTEEESTVESGCGASSMIRTLRLFVWYEDQLTVGQALKCRHVWEYGDG